VARALIRSRGRRMFSRLSLWLVLRGKAHYFQHDSIVQGGNALKSKNITYVLVTSAIMSLAPQLSGPVDHTAGIVRPARQQGEPKRVEPVFEDDFESGAYSKRAGGRWVGGNSGNVRVVREGAGSAYALGLTHRAKPSGKMSTAEQRFRLDKGASELWISFDFFVPKNFHHREPDGNSNNKFLALWEENYNGWVDKAKTVPAVRFLFEFRPMNDLPSHRGANGDSYLYVNGVDRRGRQKGMGPKAMSAFSDRERGKWNQVRIHVRLASTENTSDGLVELDINGKQTLHSRNLATPSAAAGRYLKNGYFLGWANSGYNEDMNFKIDNVRFYTTNPQWTAGPSKD
jgi:hypothetical protein